MNKKDIVIGAAILGILLVAIYALRNSQQNQKTAAATPSPTPSIEQKIESAFKITIPEDADKAELSGISGSDASGIATRSFDKGQFRATILADLADPQSGVSYKAWVAKSVSDKPEDRVTLGTLRVAKGGWMIEYQSNKDLREYKTVIVTQEGSKDGGTILLQGSFK